MRFQQPWVAGLHSLGKLQVYINRGTGYWDPPMRLGTPSEITLLRLRLTRPPQPQSQPTGPNGRGMGVFYSG